MAERLVGLIPAAGLGTRVRPYSAHLPKSMLPINGIPNLQRLHKLQVGENVKEQLQSDLDFETRGIKFLNDGIDSARKAGDNGSEDLFKKILVSEEEHIDWLETQLSLIQRIGEANYLAQQLDD